MLIFSNHVKCKKCGGLLILKLYSSKAGNIYIGRCIECSHFFRTEETLEGTGYEPSKQIQEMRSAKMKLFKVTCRGMKSSATGTAHGIAYVIAETPDEAYIKVRKDLDKRNLGFEHERELESVELLAEDKEYPACRTRLYI